MLKYRCAIFDLDGTLLDTIPDLTDAVNTTMEHFGLPKRSPEEVTSFLGHGGRNLIMQCAGMDDCEKLGEIFAYYTALYGKNYKRLTRPYDGIPEALEKLAKAGVKLAVLSNKGHQMTVPLIEKCLPEIRFDVVFGQRPNVALKPEAGAVYEILDVIGAKPEETIYFGDSEVDIQTARNAKVDMGIAAWGYRSREDLEKAGAECLLDDPAQIPALFGLE